MKIIFDYNRTLFDPEKGILYPNVLLILNLLYLKHELYLVSKKEEGRLEKFHTTGIGNFFKQVLFVDNKSIFLFKEIAGEEENVFVIGDYVKNEIFIGNKLNFKTIWVQQGKFKNVLPSNEEEKPTYKVNKILEILEIIKKYEI